MNALSLPHGLHRDVPHEVYHARVLGLVSKGALDIVHRSPLHYRTWALGREPEEISDPLAFGSAFHCAILEPERFDAAYVVAPDFGDCRFKEPKANRDAWRAANTGRLVIEADDFSAIRGMRDALRAHPLASRMLHDGDRELTVRWKDTETGLECKSRADYHVPRLRLCVDLKTTEDASLEGFRRTVAKWGYHRQNALYGDGFAACGAPLDHFVFIAVEKTPPYAIAIYTLDFGTIAKGRNTIRQDLQTLADCVARGEWPGYAPGIQSLSLPDWAA